MRFKFFTKTIDSSAPFGGHTYKHADREDMMAFIQHQKTRGRTCVRIYHDQLDWVRAGVDKGVEVRSMPWGFIPR